MKILFAQKLPYLPGFNGATRLGRSLLEGLAERGHECRVIALAGTAEKLRRGASSQSAISAVVIRDLPPAPQVFIRNGVKVYAFQNGAQLHHELKSQAETFDPDWIILSEDPTYMLVAVATEIDPRRTILFAQSQATLPFGPEAFVTDRLKERLLQEVAGMLCSSKYLQEYIRRWSSLDSCVVSAPIFGVAPFPHLGSFDNPYVTLINPSKIKGLPIFLELARRFPQTKFAAVPTWATVSADRRACAELPNVVLLEPSEAIDDILAQTRILLTPSLWGEAFGLVAVEAMLRGVPVLASNVGGLVEAKLGVDYILPVQRIESYQSARDENGIPLPIIPDQNVEPWESALRKVLSSRGEFERLSAESRAASVDYASGRSVEPTEQYLENLLRRRRSSIASAGAQTSDWAMQLESWPIEKLELLAAHVKKSRKD
jgi:glycosyltransferase involved in cell wall biosynthesis